MKYFLPLILVILFASCRKEINVDITNVEKKYVIEGYIADYANSCKVKISQTLNFTDSNKVSYIDTALVTLTDNNGTPIKLTPKNGEYTTDLKGRPGHTYNLRVVIGKNVFTAVSTMPKKVPFDSLLISERVFLGKKRKMAAVKFNDPPGVYNAYRFVEYIDGNIKNDIFVFDDKLIDGRPVFYELLFYTDDKYTLKKDDQLTVQMRCIDQPNYMFWYSLQQGALGQSQSASPANPISNIQGGALGYFSANTFESKNIAVLED